MTGHDGLEKYISDDPDIISHDPSRPTMTDSVQPKRTLFTSPDASGHDQTRRDMSSHVQPEKAHLLNSDTSRHDASRPDMSGDEKGEHGSPTEPDAASRVALLEIQLQEKDKRIKDKDDQIDFLKEELTDRRDQIRGMRQIIGEQKMLLETMVAPI
jgi:hypothetical protein